MKTTIKLLIFILTVVLICQCEKNDLKSYPDPDPDPYLNYPHFEITDTAFLYALINEGIDKNGDSLISYAESELVESLHIGGCTYGGDIPIAVFPNYGNIARLDGIEAFKNLHFLDCSFNNLTCLDVFDNLNLTFLDCSFNQLTSLDVSGCAKLNVLICEANNLTNLKLSNNVELELLRLGYRTFAHQGGQDSLFTSLDLSVNNKLKLIWLDCMPSLTRVCVWALPFPPEGVGVSAGSNVYFTTDCSKKD